MAPTQRVMEGWNVGEGGLSCGEKKWRGEGGLRQGAEPHQEGLLQQETKIYGARLQSPLAESDIHFLRGRQYWPTNLTTGNTTHPYH